MRVPLRPLLLAVSCLAAWPSVAAAAPAIRWINRFGDGVTTPLKRVIAESGTELRVETAAGETKTIPVWRLVWLERESEQDARQSALLSARRDVRMGHNLTAAATALDRVAKSATGWQKEYALAARAVAAIRGKEPEAVGRCESFLKAYPESRFRGIVLRWLTSATIKTGMSRNEAFSHYEAGYKQMGRLGAPLLERCLMWRQCGALYDLGNPQMAKVYGQSVEGGMRREMEGKDDLAYHAMVLAAPGYIELDAVIARRRSAAIRGVKPTEALRRAKLLKGRIGLALEELRCDVWREVARLYAAAGQAEQSDHAWKKAAALAETIGDHARTAVIVAERGPDR